MTGMPFFPCTSDIPAKMEIKECDSCRFSGVSKWNKSFSRNSVNKESWHNQNSEYIPFQNHVFYLLNDAVKTLRTGCIK